MDGGAAMADAIDRLNIVDVLSRYHHMVDAKNWDGLHALFLPDAVAEYRSLNDVELFDLEGRYTPTDAIVEWIRRGQEPFQFNGAPTHFMTNHLVTVTGDAAQSVSYFIDFDLISGKAIGTGFYKCTHARTPQGWRIGHMLLEQRLCDDLVAVIQAQRSAAEIGN